MLGVVLTGGSDSSSSATAAKLPDAADVQQLLAGIPQNGNVLGKPSAPVTVIEYIDLQCPFCRQFETEAMPTIISNYVRKGKAKVESRVIAFIGPDSQTGREAALAAASRTSCSTSRSSSTTTRATENTGWLNDDIIKSAAASIPGLDASQFLSDRELRARVKNQSPRSTRRRKAAGVSGTPTIYVVHKGGEAEARASSRRRATRRRSRPRSTRPVELAPAEVAAEQLVEPAVRLGEALAQRLACVAAPSASTRG